jgi:hypothetical protein
MDDNSTNSQASKFIELIDQNKSLTSSKILKKLFQKLNNLYTQQLNKVSIFKEDKLIYKVRNVYVTFMNYKILKEIKRDISEKIRAFQGSLKNLFDSLVDIKNRVISRLKILFSIMEKLPSIIYKFQSYINNENNLIFEKENFILDYSYSKLKTYMSSYIKILKHNKEIEIGYYIANNRLEMTRSFFKYFYPERFNSKIVNNIGLRNLIKSKLNSDGDKVNILDHMLLITPQNQINLDDVVLSQVNRYTGSFGFFQAISGKYGKSKISLYDNEIYLTGRFIHFAERRGNVYSNT